MARLSKKEKQRVARDREKNAATAAELLGDFGAADAATYVRRLIRDEGTRLERPGAQLTNEQRSMMLVRLGKLAGELGRIDGTALNIDERRFCRTPVWNRIASTIVEALRRHPEAAADVGRALRELGGRA